MDFEQRPGLKWCSFFCRIATMENEGLRSSVVLDRWEKEERCLSKWELCRVAKELRKFRHFKLTLDKYLIAMDEGSKMGAKMATTRIKLLRNKREAQIEYRMRLRPNFFDAWSNLASAYTRKGKLNEAAQCCRQALSLNPHLKLLKYRMQGFRLLEQLKMQQ